MVTVFCSLQELVLDQYQENGVVINSACYNEVGLDIFNLVIWSEHERQMSKVLGCSSIMAVPMILLTL
jgi:hypothetical protein